MTIQQSLPFKIGDNAETKSFQSGFRGAWFRCKILDIRRKKGEILYALQYFDYPDEGIKLMKIYQKPSRSCSVKEVKRELMVRPPFPPVYRENELHNVKTVSEVVVVVDGVWRVGDLVDWSYDGCFWSGTITEIKGEDEVEIKLPEPPLGEGKIYEASCKDLRPSLDWSPEVGWIVPKSSESRNGRSCVRLILPTKQDLAADPLPVSLVDVAEDDTQNIRATPNSLLEFDESTSSHTSASSLPLLSKAMHSKDLVQKNKEQDMLQKHGAQIDFYIGGSTTGRPSCSDGVSSTYVRDVSDEAPGANPTQEQHDGGMSAKKMRVDESIALNSTDCDSMESTITDLEELVNRVRWLRQILKLGIPAKSQGPEWKFLEHPSGSTLK